MNDERHYPPDEDGKTWLVDKDGEYVRDATGDRVPGPTRRLVTSSGFTHYDTSQWHCAFCGRLSCRGGCFR